MHTLRVVVLYSDHAATGLLSTLHQQVLVNWLEGEGVNHADVDTLFLQVLVGQESLMKSYTCTHHCHLVTVRATYHLYQQEIMQAVFLCAEAKQAKNMNLKDLNLKKHNRTGPVCRVDRVHLKKVFGLK